MYSFCIHKCDVEATWHVFWITVVLAKGNIYGGFLPLKIIIQDLVCSFPKCDYFRVWVTG